MTNKNNPLEGHSPSSHSAFFSDPQRKGGQKETNHLRDKATKPLSDKATKRKGEKATSRPLPSVQDKDYARKTYKLTKEVVKKVIVESINRECNEYEIVQQALEDYFK